MAYLRLFLETMSAAVIASGVLAASSVAFAAPASITVALPGDFPGLDPSKDTSPLGFNYRLNVFDALTELQRDGQMVPVLLKAGLTPTICWNGLSSCAKASSFTTAAILPPTM